MIYLFSRYILIIILSLLLSNEVYANENIIDHGYSKINIILRYDDYSAKSDIELEKRIIKLLQKYNIKCTFGVTPFICSGSTHDLSNQILLPLPDNKIVLLNEAINSGVLEIALHGTTHQTITHNVFGSEYIGLEKTYQFQKIKIGKDYLEKYIKQNIITFIPPWNSYDDTTLEVLEELNFSIISAGADGLASNKTNLLFLPSTCYNIQKLSAVIQSIKKNDYKKPLIIVLFHGYDFLEVDKKRGKISFSEFEKLLNYLADQENIITKSFSELSLEEKDLGIKRFLLYNTYNKYLKYLPSFLFYHEKNVYLTSEELKAFKKIILVIITLFYLTIIVISFLFNYYTLKFFINRNLLKLSVLKFVLAINIIILFSSIIYAMKDLFINIKGAIVITFLFSQSIGFFLNIYKSAKNQDN